MTFNISYRDKLAYLAGIIDGEGTICIRPNKLSYSPSISVGSTSPSLISWLEINFGGTVSQKKLHGNRQDSQVWVLHKRELVRNLLIEIYPHLIIKQLNAHLVYQFYNEFPARKRCSAAEKVRMKQYAEAASLLNARGDSANITKASVTRMLLHQVV